MSISNSSRTKVDNMPGITGSSNNKKFDITVDQVNHPSHYTSDPSGVECIQITRHRNFNIGNAFKYLWRAGLKDDKKQIEDLQKAIFYIQDEIKRLEGTHEYWGRSSKTSWSS